MTNKTFSFKIEFIHTEWEFYEHLLELTSQKTEWWRSQFGAIHCVPKLSETSQPKIPHKQ